MKLSESSPLVSVLVTVYNREPYLRESLESIIRSDFLDFEVIVVDDCSSDNSLAVAEEVAAGDNRIKTYANERNLGQFRNRDHAASLAQGKYLKYVDSDDIIYPHSIGVMVGALERYPDAALALSHAYGGDKSPYPWCLSPEQCYKKQFVGRGCLSAGPSGAIMRRDAYESIGGYDSSWGVIADIELWFRIAARWPTVLLPPGLVWWRRHEEQDFAKDDAELVYLQRGYKLTQETLKRSECPLSVEDCKTALKKSRHNYSRRLISLALRRRQLGTALRLYGNSDLTIFDLAKGLRPYQ